LPDIIRQLRATGKKGNGESNKENDFLHIAWGKCYSNLLVKER